MRLDPTSHTDIMTELRDLKLRLHALETAPGLANYHTTSAGTSYESMTGGVYETLFELPIMHIPGDTLKIKMFLEAESSPATTGVYQFKVETVPGAQVDTTDEIEVVSGTNVKYLNWTPDPTAWPIGEHSIISLQGKRTSGSGLVQARAFTVYIATLEEIPKATSGGFQTTD